ncbi:MAG: hypothetical protein CMC70_01295 [Flavobacteriaceae bacterium]|nr:hypothetical protein [Flavobacteriaceae bacterium]
MGRVTDRSAFNTPVAPYKRVGRSRPKRDAIDTALGLIRVAKGVGPLIDAAAAGISGAVAKGERAEAIEAEKQKRLAQEAEKKRQEALQAQAAEAERLKLEEIATYGPGSVELERPAILDARLGRAGRRGQAVRAARRLGGAPGYQLRMPGETSAPGTGPVLTRPPATDLQFKSPILSEPYPYLDFKTGAFEGKQDLPSPQMLDAQLALRPELAAPVAMQPVPSITPTPPAPPAPGVVYPPGTPGEPPKPAMPVPAGTVAKRFYDAAAKRREYLERTRGTAIPSMESLLSMSLDELRTLAKFGLSADPRRRVAELKRIGDAATVVGRVEKAPGLLGLITGTRGGAAGRKYALELARREKAQADELDMAGKMVSIESAGENVERKRKRRLRKRGGGSGVSRAFRMLYYKDGLDGLWKPKYKSSTYWGSEEGRKEKGGKNAFVKQYDKLSIRTKRKHANAARAFNAAIKSGRVSERRGRAPSDASSRRLDLGSGAVAAAKPLGITVKGKGNIGLSDPAYKNEFIRLVDQKLDPLLNKPEKELSPSEKNLKRRLMSIRSDAKAVTPTDVRRGGSSGGRQPLVRPRGGGGGGVEVQPAFKGKN